MMYLLLRENLKNLEYIIHEYQKLMMGKSAILQNQKFLPFPNCRTTKYSLLSVNHFESTPKTYQLLVQRLYHDMY
ncbi:hypothetical protein DJ519_01445 [Klebsiella michiganensis]|nr:hypothetical protein DJ519_01445 [Klebsiella michiganensis]